MAFSQIKVKAATVTGAVICFLSWLFFTPFWLARASATPYYGMMGYLAGYGALWWVLGAVLFAIGGAIFGAVLALVYNWALKLKW